MEHTYSISWLKSLESHDALVLVSILLLLARLLSCHGMLLQCVSICDYDTLSYGSYVKSGLAAHQELTAPGLMFSRAILRKHSAW